MSAHRKYMSSAEQRLRAEELRMELDCGAPDPHQSHALAEQFVAQLKEDLARVEQQREALALDVALSFIEFFETSSDSRDLVRRMTELYPDNVNPSALVMSAITAFKHKKRQEA